MQLRTKVSLSVYVGGKVYPRELKFTDRYENNNLQTEENRTKQYAHKRYTK